jgi:Holliday junction resolvase-like predicted endonuclease
MRKVYIDGNSSCVIKPFTVLLEGKDKDWQIVKDNTQSWTWESTTIQVVVQGNIEYPLNINLLKNHIKGEAKDLLTTNFRLVFPIGELDISASREELIYNEITIKNIAEKFNKIAQEISNTVSSKISSFNTEFQAKQYLSDLKSEVNVCHSFNYYYKGEKLKNNCVLTNDYDFASFSRNFRGSITRTAYFNDLGEYYTFTIPTSKSNSIFVFDDEGRKGKAIAKARSLVDDYSAVYLIYKADEALIEVLGRPNVKLTSEMEMPEKPSKKK